MELRKSKKPWSEQDEAEMLRLAFAKTPIRIMKVRLGRTAAAIIGRLQKIKREKIAGCQKAIGRGTQTC
jgi:hypothetical protein